MWEAQNSPSVTQLFIPAVGVNAVLGDTPYPLLFQVSRGSEEEKWHKKAVQGLNCYRAEGQTEQLLFRELCWMGKNVLGNQKAQEKEVLVHIF